jgi:predicted ATP-grasp superfamily ATP-dependent carboligase
MSVLRAGYRCEAADLFADEDLRRICPVTRIANYPAGLVDWLRATRCDAWFYTGALENHPDLVDELAALRTLWGNPGNVLRRVRDPMLLQHVLRDHFIAFPETRTSAYGLPRDGSWLAKSYRGSGGAGVARLNHSAKNCVFFQRFITGDPGSAVFADGELVGVTRQLIGEFWTGARPFQYCGTVAPWVLPADVQLQLRRLGTVLANDFSLVGLYGADFIFDGTRTWVLEVNPRYTAAVEILEGATERGLVASRHRRGSLGRPAGSSHPMCRGKAILFARIPTTVGVEFAQWAVAQPDLADIPSAGNRIPPGQPVLTVLAEAESFPLIMPALKSRMGEVGIRLWGGAGSCDWVS